MPNIPRGSNGGFTMIELMIITAIIGILASIAMLGYKSYRDKTYVAAMQSDLAGLAIAQEAYYESLITDSGGPRYTATLEDLEFTKSEGVSIRLLAATEGWAAEATHKALPGGVRCAIFRGAVEPFDPAEMEGVLTCGSG